MSKLFCEPCGHEHGPLYICPRYSPERKAEIRVMRARWRSSAAAYLREQLAKGIPLEALRIMGWLSGVDVDAVLLSEKTQ